MSRSGRRSGVGASRLGTLLELTAVGIDEAFHAWDERPGSTLAVAAWRRRCRQTLRRVLDPEI
jgi:hypothetical protein